MAIVTYTRSKDLTDQLKQQALELFLCKWTLWITYGTQYIEIYIHYSQDINRFDLPILQCKAMLKLHGDVSQVRKHKDMKNVLLAL